MGFGDQFGLGVVLTMKNLISASAQAARKDLKDLGDTAVKTQSWVTKSSQQLADEQKDILKGYRAIGIASMAAGTAILGTVAFMVKQAADSETYMAKVKVNLLASGTAASLATLQVGGLFTEIERVSDALGTNKDEMEIAAAGLAQIVGYDQAKASLKSIAELSVATDETIATSAGAVSGVLRVYSGRWGTVMTQQEKAARAATVLFNAAKMSGLEFTAFNEILSQTAAESASMGVSFEDSAASLAFMARTGPRGRMLMSGVRAYYESMRQLMTKTSAPMTLSEALSGPKANDPRSIAASMGLKLTNEKGQTLSFYESLVQLEKHYGITAEKAAIAQKKIKDGNLQGAAAAAEFGISLQEYAKIELVYMQQTAEAFAEGLGRSSELKKMIDDVGKQERLKEAVDTMTDTLSHWVAAIKNALMSITDTLGQPFLDSLKDGAKSVVKFILAVKQLAMDHPTLTKWVMTGTALLGVLLLVGGAVTVAATSFALLNLAMLANPIALITLAITGVIAAVVLLVSKWDWFKEKTIAAWTAVKTAVMWTFEHLSEYIKSSPIYQLLSWIFEMTGEGILRVQSILGIRDEGPASTVMSAMPQQDWGAYSQPNAKQAAAELITLATKGNVTNNADYGYRHTTNNLTFLGGNVSDQVRVFQKALSENALRSAEGAY